jgi:hypothetical protein
MMLRVPLLVLIVALFLPGLRTIGGQSSSSSASTPATPDNAKAFIGDWLLSADSDNGPVTFSLSVKVDSGNVVADLSSAMQPDAQHITSLFKNGTTFELHYDFDYQGAPIPVVLTLTPDGDNVAMKMDFANGAYDMSGKATKKKS